MSLETNSYNHPVGEKIARALESPESLAYKRVAELLHAVNTRQDPAVLKEEVEKRRVMGLSRDEAIGVVTSVLDEQIRIADNLLEAALSQPPTDSSVGEA